MGVLKKGKNWFIDYYVEGRRKRERIGPSKKQAVIVLDKRRVQIAENRFLDVKKNERILFKDMASLYLANHSRPNKKSYRRDISCVNNLNPVFGGRYIYEITALDIEKYKLKRKEKVSNATVNRDVACLKHILKKAVEWGKATQNPAANVKLLKERNARIRYLEEEEIKALLDASPDHLKAILITALNTGMRKGEILGLKWKDINFRQGVIVLLETKNNERREVPVNKLLFKVLLPLRKNPDSPYVFCKKDGKPYRNVRTSFETAKKKAGIEDFRFHDLRHTFASHLVMTGVGLKTVQELLGLKSFEMTLRYAHLSPDHKKRAVDILGDRMDTIWTPTGSGRKEAKKGELCNPDLESITENAPVAQVDRAAVS